MSILPFRPRGRMPVLALAALAGIAFAAQAAQPAASLAVVSHAIRLERGDVVHGAVPLSRPIRLTVVLKLRNAAQLRAFNAKPHRPIASARLAANYLPTAAQAQAIERFLTQSGFKHVRIAPNHMLVTATGTAATAQAAFHTSFVRVRTRDGRTAFANSSEIRVPAGLRSSVQAVLGLQTLHKAHTLARLRPQAVSGIGGHNPLEFASIYGADGLQPATSIAVGILSAGDMTQTLADLATFAGNNGLPPVTTQVVCVDPGPYDYGSPNGAAPITNDPTCAGNQDQGTGEWDLDSQDIIAMSGGVQSLTFYSANTLFNADLTDALNEIVSEDAVQVVNISLGECERFADSGQPWGDGSAQADDQIFQIGVAQGQTFAASTGDSGADECGDGGSDSASYPASSPYVVAVGGTTLNASNTAYSRETAWEDGGGSPSSFEPMPSWQAGFATGAMRGVPDVAFDANPESGAVVVFNGSPAQAGGTSLAAPLFAGAWARLLANGLVQTTSAAQQLYAMPATDFHDVIAGNNRGLAAPGHGYRAKRGWDYASGRGSLDLGAIH